MKTLALLISMASLLIAGCVSPTTVDYDRMAAPKISKYQSFVIDSREARSNYQDIVLSPIVDRRIEQAISRTLQAKGMTPDSAQPDFRVTFNTVTKTKTEVNDLGVGPTPFRRYPYAYGGYSQIDINQYEEGTFIVDIIDQASKELVWRGTYTKRLGWSSPNDAEVQEIISEILVNFPPQT